MDGGRKGHCPSAHISRMKELGEKKENIVPTLEGKEREEVFGGKKGKGRSAPESPVRIEHAQREKKGREGDRQPGFHLSKKKKEDEGEKEKKKSGVPDILNRISWCSRREKKRKGRKRIASLLSLLCTQGKSSWGGKKGGSAADAARCFNSSSEKKGSAEHQPFRRGEGDAGGGKGYRDIYEKAPVL